MKKLFSLSLLVSFQFCYLEWAYNSAFIFQLQWEIILKALDTPLELIHPAILLPLAGEILLLITLLQKNAAKKLITLAIFFLGVLVMFILFIGIFISSLKVIGSTLPFLTLSVFYFIKGRKL